jgi:hypothetical protein
MRVIAAAERNVQNPRDDPVVGEGALASQQSPILGAFDAGSDVLWANPKGEIHAFTPQAALSAVCHRDLTDSQRDDRAPMCKLRDPRIRPASARC